eukprot:7465451-Pyramimonas_sp.AAC.1
MAIRERNCWMRSGENHTYFWHGTDHAYAPQHAGWAAASTGSSQPRAAAPMNNQQERLSITRQPT